MKPPFAVRSTPPLGTASAAREMGAADGGMVTDSVPADAATGSTTSSVRTERPARDSRTWGGGLSTSDTGRPSSRASRTISPAGICTRVQPSRRTSIVSSARPLTESLSTRSS